MYEPLELTKCKKCDKIIAEPKESIRIKKREYIEPEEKVCQICGSPLENGCCLLCSLDEEEIEEF